MHRLFYEGSDAVLPYKIKGNDQGLHMDQGYELFQPFGLYGISFFNYAVIYPYPADTPAIAHDKIGVLLPFKWDGRRESAHPVRPELARHICPVSGNDSTLHGLSASVRDGKLYFFGFGRNAPAFHHQYAVPQTH